MNRTVAELVRGYEGGSITRRELLLALSALVAGAGTVGATRRAQEAPFRGRTLNHTTMFVSDLDRSVEFYRNLFGVSVRSTQENGVNLALGEQSQFLGLYTAPPSGPTIHHVCVGVEDFDPDEAMEKLEAFGVETGRIRMRGETPELYFTDPDGLNIQIQDVRYCGGGGPLGDDC